MTPKVSGIASAMSKLKFGFDRRADELLARIGDVDRRGNVAFSKAGERLDAAESSINDVEAMVAELEGSNGAPS